MLTTETQRHRENQHKIAFIFPCSSLRLCGSVAKPSAIRNPKSSSPTSGVKAHNEKTRYISRLGTHSELASSDVVGRDHPRVPFAMSGVLRLPARTPRRSGATAHAGGLQRPAID